MSKTKESTSRCGRRSELTDEQVEQEIERLSSTPEVKLVRKETRLRYKRRQTMYQLRYMYDRGKQLMEQGVTLDNIEEALFGDDNAELEE